MRHFLIAAAALTVGGIFAATVASAQNIQGGSPDRIGNMCKVNTDLNGDMGSYGYYAPCAPQARAQVARETAPAASQAKGYAGGAPARIGNLCKVNTDLNGDMDNYGYYVPCGRQALAQAPAREVAPTPIQAKGFAGGAPARIGNMCKVSTDLNGDMDNYGYYAPCPR